MTVNLHLLPSALAFHSRPEGAEAGIDWIERIAEWSASSLGHEFRFTADTLHYEVLEDAGFFPIALRCEDELARDGLGGDFSGRDVATLILTLLERTTPTSAVETEPIRATSDIERVCACQCHPNLADWDLDWAASGARRTPGERQAFFLSSSVSVTCSTPCSAAAVDGTAYFLASGASAYDVLNAADYLCETACTSERLNVAILAAIKQGFGVSAAPVKVDAMQTFAEGIANCIASGETRHLPAILNGAGKILTGTYRREVHELRRSAGPGSPQIFHDGWGAWRMVLGGGWRIHFWRKGDSRKLATVHAHDSFDIPRF